MLQNRIYFGEIVHKGKAFPGEHQATVDEELWQKVQNHLEANRVARRDGDNAIEPLTGLVFDTQGELMTPTHAVKKGTRHRYYVLCPGNRVKELCGDEVCEVLVVP